MFELRTWQFGWWRHRRWTSAATSGSGWLLLLFLLSRSWILEPNLKRRFKHNISTFHQSLRLVNLKLLMKIILKTHNIKFDIWQISFCYTKHHYITCIFISPWTTMTLYYWLNDVTWLPSKFICAVSRKFRRQWPQMNRDVIALRVFDTSVKT